MRPSGSVLEIFRVVYARIGKGRIRRHTARRTEEGLLKLHKAFHPASESVNQK